jgi:hypothetical protein
MSKKTMSTIEAHAALTAAITEAVKTAAAAGLTPSDISAALNRIQELVDSEEN